MAAVCGVVCPGVTLKVLKQLTVSDVENYRAVSAHFKRYIVSMRNRGMPVSEERLLSFLGYGANPEPEDAVEPPTPLLTDSQFYFGETNELID